MVINTSSRKQEPNSFTNLQSKHNIYSKVDVVVLMVVLNPKNDLMEVNDCQEISCLFNLKHFGNCKGYIP